MHASIRRYIVHKGNETEAIARAKNDVLPALKTLPGFVAYYFIDSGEGDMIAVSVFESKEAATRANEYAAGYVSEHLSDVLRRMSVMEGSVMVSEDRTHDRG